jgi:hypothetical protein
MAYRHRRWGLFYAGRPYPDTSNGRALNGRLVPLFFNVVKILTGSAIMART